MGEPDFPTSEPIVAAAHEALRSGWTRYGDLNGDPELRALIATQASVLSGQTYGLDQVVVTHGGSAALAATILAVVDPGDRVVLPDPTYSLYADQVELAGGTVVRVPTLPDGHLDLDAMANALRGARMFAFCNPVNPTGVVFTGDELRHLADLVAGTDTIVLADEAYVDLVYDDRKFTSALDVDAWRPNLVLCQTLSKTYAMTGWRVGYTVAPQSISTAIAAVHRGLNASINAVAQRAAIAALQAGPALAEPMLRAYHERRDYVVARLHDMPNLEFAEPAGAFYVFPRYQFNTPSAEVVRAALATGVAVRAGREFGPAGEHHLRISFAADMPTLATGLDRLATVLTGLGQH